MCMKKIGALLLCILLAGVLCSKAVAEEDDGNDIVELYVNVPFGMTIGNGLIPVLDQAQKGQQIDQIDANHICAVDKGEQVGKDKWYHVYYFDESGKEHVGNISGQNFELFTIEMLVEKASDPESMSMIDALLTLPEISATAEGSSTHDVDMNSIGFSRNQPLDETPIIYVLNTNSKRIHVPGCDSVDKIKLKNRKDLFSAVEVIPYMEKGYKPCGNCHPELPKDI